MTRGTRSFEARHADEQKREALDTITMTERLLAHILIELMESRASRKQADFARRLRHVGFSTKQVAALLDTTPAALYVTERRERPESVDAVAKGGEVL
jgi:transcriptional regulator